MSLASHIDDVELWGLDRLAEILGEGRTVLYSCDARAPFGLQFVSGNIEDLFGYLPDPMMANSASWLSLVHPDDAARLKGELERCALGLAPLRCDYRVRSADGAWRWVEDRGRLLCDQDGRPERIAGTWLDVTDRRASEAQAEASQRRYRHVVDAAAEGIWILDANLETVYASARTASLLGSTSFEMVGRPMSEFLFPEDRAAAPALFAAGRNAGGFELRMRRRDGQELWAKLSSQPMTEGRPPGNLLLMLTDVSELHRAEAHRERLTAAHRAARVEADGALRRLGVLARITSELSRPSDQAQLLDRLAHQLVAQFAEVCEIHLVEGDRVQQVVAAVRGEQHDTRAAATPSEAGPCLALDHPVAQAIHEGTSLVSSHMDAEVEARWFGRSPPVTDHAIRSSMIVLLEAHGAVIGAVSLHRTEGSPAWEDADESVAKHVAGLAAVAVEGLRVREALERSTTERDRLLTLLGHELRNPLGPMINAIEILERVGTTDPRGARSLATLKRQVRHEANLVDDLLNITRLTRGTLTLQLNTLDVVELVRFAVDDHRAAIDAAGLALDLRLPPRAIWVSGDATRLAQVVGNLLGNAMKFTDPGGRIVVRVEESSGGERVTISVSDTGIGVTPEQLAKLWTPFAQSVEQHPGRRGGLGLGLASSRRLVELHGGSIEARSAGVGAGTEVVFTLPGVARERSAAVEVAPEKTHRARVLIIEDNRDAGELMRDLLELFGSDVELSCNGGDGIRLALAHPPDVVLCDLGLPDMTGFEVARRLRREPTLAATRLVAVTGYGLEQDRRRARQAGFDEHLVKPLRPEQLRRVVGQVDCHR